MNPELLKVMIGSVYLWEPEKPHARSYLKVTDVIWNGEEFWVEGIDLKTGRKCGNELDRFLEAISYDASFGGK